MFGAPVSHQADAIYDMIGFPDFILDSKELDDVYDGVRTHTCTLPLFHLNTQNPTLEQTWIQILPYLSRI